MSEPNDRGMSLHKVAVLAFCLVAYFLWGGAAAIYQAHLDEEAAALAAEQPDAALADDEEWDDGDGTIRVRRGSALVAVVVVTVMAVWTFISNSVIHVASLYRMIPFFLTKAIWYPLFSAVVLGLVGGGYLWMGKLQQTLESGGAFKTNRKRSKLPKIRTPKPTEL